MCGREATEMFLGQQMHTLDVGFPDLSAAEELRFASCLKIVWLAVCWTGYTTTGVMPRAAQHYQLLVLNSCLAVCGCSPGHVPSDHPTQKE
jgi:hypothetical protein